MANELHTMPLKIESLLSSHKVRMLELDEFGAYVKLLCDAWLNGGYLPAYATSNAQALQKLCGCNANDAQRIIDNVVNVFFVEDENGNMCNKRQLEIYHEVQRKALNAKEKAKKAAVARWGNAPSNAQALHEQCQPKPKSKPNTKEKIQKKFIPPELADVRQYCQDRKNNVNPESFVDFYASKGWMVGKNKMKDWQAAVRTWERNENKTSNDSFGDNWDSDTKQHKQVVL